MNWEMVIQIELLLLAWSSGTICGFYLHKIVQKYAQRRKDESP